MERSVIRERPCQWHRRSRITLRSIRATDVARSIRNSPQRQRRLQGTRMMNGNVSPPPGAVPWEEVRGRLDQNGPFSNMFDTPLYRDAVWEQFSRQEYARRSEPLELRRRHDLAHRPLGVARDLVLRGGAARCTADADLLHGRHPRGGRAPPGRAGALRCA